MVFFYSPKKKI